MAQFFDPLLIMSLALNFVALGVSRIRGVINAVAAQGISAGRPRAFHPPGHRRPGRRAGHRDDHLEGVRDPAVPRARHARGEHPARGQSGRRLHELAPSGGGRHRVGDGVLVHAPPAPGAPALLLVPASLSTVWTGFLLLDHAQEGDHAGASAICCSRTGFFSLGSCSWKRCRFWSRPASCSTCSPACS